MKAYFDDAEFDGQFQRTLYHSYERAADLGEAFSTAARIKPGDYGSWYDEWSKTAETVRAAAAESQAGGRAVSAAEAFLRASEYHRQAYFFVRHDLDDPRLLAGYNAMRDCFRAAARLLPFPCEEVSIPFEQGALRGYLSLADDSGRDRPTVLYPAGYDSPAEDGSFFAFPALRRGFNVLSFEGPGQGGVLYEQRLFFRPDFEAVLTPVVDWALQRPEVAGDRLVLVGRSFGGFLAPRGASAEHRLAALVADPGQYDMGSRLRARTPADLFERALADDQSVDAELQPLLDDPHGQEYFGARMAAHGTPTVRQWYQALMLFSLEGRADQITCPTLVTDGEGDFAGEQSVQLYEALTCPKQRRHFTDAEGAGGHCEGMGQQVWNQYTFDWIEDTLARGPGPQT